MFCRKNKREQKGEKIISFLLFNFFKIGNLNKAIKTINPRKTEAFHHGKKEKDRQITATQNT